VIVALVFVGLRYEILFSACAKLWRLCSPLLYGFCIAYLVNPALSLFERKIFDRGALKKHPKLRRVLAMLATYIIYSLAIILLLTLIIPQVVSSYTDLIGKMDGYVASAQSWVENLASSSDFIGEQYKKLMEYVDFEKLTDTVNELIGDSYSLLQSATPYVIDFFTAAAQQFKNAFFGIFFSVYFLMSKEKLCAQLKKTLYALLPRTAADKTVSLARYSDNTFGKFIIGKLLDSLIIGVLSFIVFAVMKMPYYQLVAVIIGITNVIPFFGPIIGAIPSVFIIFIADPSKALWFLIAVVVIQQLDGNVIGPKILGDSTGLSAFWVIVAITIMGGIMGVAGMFIGVPAFAVLYYLIRGVVERALESKKLPTATDDYMKGGEDKK